MAAATAAAAKPPQSGASAARALLLVLAAADSHGADDDTDDDHESVASLASTLALEGPGTADAARDALADLISGAAGRKMVPVCVASPGHPGDSPVLRARTTSDGGGAALAAAVDASASPDSGGTRQRSGSADTAPKKPSRRSSMAAWFTRASATPSAAAKRRAAAGADLTALSPVRRAVPPGSPVSPVGAVAWDGRVSGGGAFTDICVAMASEGTPEGFDIVASTVGGRRANLNAGTKAEGAYFCTRRWASPEGHPTARVVALSVIYPERKERVPMGFSVARRGGMACV